MANPEWGTKRICSSCGTKYYDLNRTPITCPKCETPYVSEPPPKPRRSAAPAAVVEPPEAAVEAKPDSPDTAPAPAEVIDGDKASDEDDGDDKGLKNDKSDKDTGIIEDASELGEDEHDMAEVIDGIENNKANDKT